MNRNVRVSLLLAVTILVWLLSGLWFPQKTQSLSDFGAGDVVALTQVQARYLSWEYYSPTMKLFAETHANRHVFLRAQITGEVISTPQARGVFVTAGQTICELDSDGRQADYVSAQSSFHKSQLEYTGFLSLKRNQFQSELTIARAAADLEKARVRLNLARDAVDNLQIKAPFNGFLETRFAEVGDYLQPGELCGLIVELNPLRVRAHVTDLQISQVETAQFVEFEASNGEKHPATINYISSMADSQIRTFLVEAIFPNPASQMRSGVMGKLIVTAPKVIAHQIPGSVLLLDDNGEIIQPDFDHTENGQYCFVTGNAVSQNDSEFGFGDVDGGKTSLISPQFDLSEYSTAAISYWRWYSNSAAGGANPGNDVWRVDGSNDGGNTWVSLELTNENSNEWTKHQFILNDNTIPLSNQMKFRFIAEDIFYEDDNGSGGSIIEAALDDFQILVFNDNLLGDLNYDGSLNVQDVVIMINMILGNIESDLIADINNDGGINIQDVVILINSILR